MGRTGVAITTRDLAEGQAVLVRARVLTAFRHAAILRVPTLRTGEYPLEVPFSEIFAPGSTDAIAGTLQALQSRGEAFQALIGRAIAEVYELGQHASTPPEDLELPAPTFWPPAQR